MSTTTKVVATVAVLAAAYTGVTWYMGTQAEPEIQRQVAEFNTTMATHSAAQLDEGGMHLEIVSYNRGLFSSNINYELMINTAEEQYQLLFTDHLRHGPLPVAAVLKGHLAPVLAYSELKLLPSQNVQGWFEATKGETPVTAHSFIDFNGSSKSQINVAAVDYKNEYGDEIQTATINADVNYQADTDFISIDAEIPSLVFIEGEDKTHLQFQGAHFVGSMTGSFQEQSSTANLHIEQLRLNMAQSAQVWIDKLSADSSYTLAGGLLDSSLRYDLANVKVDGHDLGQIELDLEAKRLDYEVLMLLSQSEQVDALSEIELQPLLERFFSHQPELKINPFSWKNAAGQSHVIVDAKMATTAADNYTQNKVDPAHFFDELDLDLSISRAMLQGLFPEDNFTSNLVDMLFTRFAAQGQEAGLLEYDQDNATLQLQFDAASNTFILNGKPAEAEDLFYSWLLLQMGGGLR